MGYFFNACAVRSALHVVFFALSAQSVLLVFKSSRRELQLSPGRPVCDLLSDEIKKAGHEATVCVSEAPGNAKPPLYILQRWSEKWQPFLDVSNESEIVDGDKLTVIPKPGLSPVSKHVRDFCPFKVAGDPVFSSNPSW